MLIPLEFFQIVRESAGGQLNQQILPFQCYIGV